MPVSLLDPSYHCLLPTPLAHAVTTLARETAENGEHTTADELVACIDALFGLLGRLWVAEYLAVGAPDARVNRLLHEQVIARKGPVLGGAWLGLARELRAAFLTHDLQPAAQGLLDMEFGEWGHDEHPFARLSAYRNSFAHGSFQAVVADIRTHSTILEGLLSGLPFLVEQPFLVDTGAGVVALRGTAETVARPENVTLLPGHPTLVGPGGRSVDLHPLALMGEAAGTRGLVWPGKKDAGARDIVKHVRFQAWFERFQTELDGHVEAATACLGSPSGWADAPAALADSLGSRERGLVLVETAPGAARAGVLAGWADTAPTLRWSAQPGSLMGSGLVLAQALLRASERVLGLPDRSFPRLDSWREALAEAGRRLEATGSIVRLAVDHLHLGDAPANADEPSVQEVWRALAGGPFLAVGGSVRQWSLRALPWDARVTFGWPAGTTFAELGPEFSAFFTSRSLPLERRILHVLFDHEVAPLDLSAVCDALEATGGEGAGVFEPEVERALWNLAPILTLGRVLREVEGSVEHIRTFELLDRSVVRAALETLP